MTWFYQVVRFCTGRITGVVIAGMVMGWIKFPEDNRQLWLSTGNSFRKSRYAVLLNRANWASICLRMSCLTVLGMHLIWSIVILDNVVVNSPPLVCTVLTVWACKWNRKRFLLCQQNSRLVTLWQRKCMRAMHTPWYNYENKLKLTEIVSIMCWVS